MKSIKIVLIIASVLTIPAMGQNNPYTSNSQLTNNKTSQPDASIRMTWMSDNGNGTFTNPLFYDEFSDPDLIKAPGRIERTAPALCGLNQTNEFYGYK